MGGGRDGDSDGSNFLGKGGGGINTLQIRLDQLLGGSRHYARRDIIKQKRFSITTGDDIGGQLESFFLSFLIPFSPDTG